MKIQFHHKRIKKVFMVDLGNGSMMGGKQLQSKGGTTIALQVPTIEQFDAFEIFPKDHWGFYSSIELDVGIAKCSSEDNYNKKLGRNIAKGRMQTIVFFARKHTENEVILSDAQGKFPELVLRRSPKGGRVHFVGVNSKK